MIVAVLLSLVAAADDAVPAPVVEAPVVDAVPAIPAIPEPPPSAEEVREAGLSLRFADHLFGDQLSCFPFWRCCPVRQI